MNDSADEMLTMEPASVRAQHRYLIDAKTAITYVMMATDLPTDR